VVSLKTNRQKAFFFDRDGVINIDHGYVSKIEDFTFMEGVFPAMRDLAGKGYRLIIITNQSGIGRGYYAEADFQKLTAWMLEQFAENDVQIEAVYNCPHHPEENCDCRKPEPGMLLKAIREHDVDPDLSWMVGDKESDMQAAEAAGIHNRVLIGGEKSGHSTHSILNLTELSELAK
jgi:D-glycero-D-manno-heptose 1,7-bisphosphate phosphatase